MSDCRRYASPSDICLVEHPKGVFCKYDDVKKLEAELDYPHKEIARYQRIEKAAQAVVEAKHFMHIHSGGYLSVGMRKAVDALAALLNSEEGKL